jgi:hypothetical protein
MTRRRTGRDNVLQRKVAHDLEAAPRRARLLQVLEAHAGGPPRHAAASAGAAHTLCLGRQQGAGRQKKLSPPKATTARVHALLALAVDADDALPLLDLKDLALDRMLEELSLVSLAACRHGVRLRGDQRALLHGQPMGAPRPAEMGSRARRCRVHGVGGGARRQRLGRRPTAPDQARELCRLSGLRVVVHLDKEPLHQGGHGRPAAHTTAAPLADTVAAWYRAL